MAGLDSVVFRSHTGRYHCSGRFIVNVVAIWLKSNAQGQYLLWQSYFDISPRVKYGALRQQIWTQLHFPFHVILILLSEGSQILALTLDIYLKLKYLGETISYACEPPRPDPDFAINLLNSTITDMEINYNHGALEEKHAIYRILEELRSNPPLCSANGVPGSLNMDRSHDLMGNITVCLFSSMGITLPADDVGAADSDALLMMYLRLLGFVYLYYFVVTSLAMFCFALFVYLTERRIRRVFVWIAIGIRVLSGIFLASLTAFVINIDLTYTFMTSPMIIFTFSLTLLAGMLNFWIAYIYILSFRPPPLALLLFAS